MLLSDHLPSKLRQVLVRLENNGKVSDVLGSGSRSRNGSGSAGVAGMFARGWGRVGTLAGVPGEKGGRDGKREQATFSFPYGVAVGGDGTVYVTEDHRVRAITPGR
jgi:hypothetical protein